MVPIGEGFTVFARVAAAVESRSSALNPRFSADALSQVNINDRSTRTGLILAINIVCMILITQFVITRLLVRRFMIGQFFLDDTLVTIASLFTVGLCVVTLIAVHYGLGRHIWSIEPATILFDVRKCVQLMYLGNIFYACAITFTKLSIIVSYLRIFPYNTLHIIMYITAGVTVALFIAAIPATVFQCRPVSAAWDLTTDNSTAKCYDLTKFLYASTAINVTTDLVLCIAPLPYFWNLHLPRKQKIVISVLFFIGGFACVASIARLSFLHLLSQGIDVTWNLAPSVLWTIAECTIGICCVSVPTARPLLSRLMPKSFLSHRAARTSTATPGVGGRRYANATDAHRSAYAMRGRSAGGSDFTKLPSTPTTDRSNGYVEEGDRELDELVTVPGTSTVVTTCAADNVVKEPNKVWRSTSTVVMTSGAVDNLKEPDRVWGKGW